MNGLGGLNKSPEGVVVGVVQLQLPAIATPADLAEQTRKIVARWAKPAAIWGRWILSSSRNIHCTACRWT